jgi:hypothetical protein
MFASRVSIDALPARRIEAAEEAEGACAEPDSMPTAPNRSPRARRRELAAALAAVVGIMANNLQIPCRVNVAIFRNAFVIARTPHD